MGRDNQEFEGALGLTPVMYAVLYNDMDMLSTVRPAALVLLAIVSISQNIKEWRGKGTHDNKHCMRCAAGVVDGWWVKRRRISRASQLPNARVKPK